MFVETKKEGEAPTKPDGTLTLRGLIAWLETQPPDKSYEYSDCNGGCLVGQYAASQGRDWYRDGVVVDRAFGLLNYIACDANHTFGGALQRAKNVLACI